MHSSRWHLGRFTTDSRGATAALLGLALLVTVLSAGQAYAFAGMLTSANGGVQGTGNWIVTGPTTISWDVIHNGDGSWTYNYLFSHPRGETSHFILEVSPTFTLDNIWNASGDYDGLVLDTFDGSNPSNPGMPGSIFGLKFDSASGLATSISFDSNRAPVWGDFYSKDGNAGGYGINAAWNAGLTANDTDPTAPASDGSVENHILRPDTFSTLPPVPEPASLLLLGMGLAGVALVSRRRRA